MLPPVRILGCLALLCALALPLRAQPTTEDVAAWGRLLDAVLSSVAQMEYVEVVEREIDGPFHTRRLHLVSDVRLCAERPERRLRTARLDGEPVEIERVHHWRDRMRQAFGPDVEMTERAADLPLAHLERFRLIGSPRAAQLDGRDAWRIELTPPDSTDAIERVTLWVRLDGRTPTLLRSRLLLQGDRPGTLHTITTDYETVRGPRGALPVPHRRHAEATFQQQRRWRTFSVVVTTETTLENVRVRWRP